MDDDFKKTASAAHDALFGVIERKVLSLSNGIDDDSQVAATLAGIFTALCDHLGVVICLTGAVIERPVDEITEKCFESIRQSAKKSTAIAVSVAEAEQIIKNALRASR